jgi:hypothetical protein
MSHCVLQYLNDSLGVQTRRVCGLSSTPAFRATSPFTMASAKVGSPPPGRCRSQDICNGDLRPKIEGF